MRRTIRSVGILLVAMLGTVGLAIGSAFSAALAFGAIGLFVPGTGTPDANGIANYLSNARDRYTLNTPCNSAADCPTTLENPEDPSLLGINYPASFFPLVIFPGWCRSGPDGCDKWNVSVGKGTDMLDMQLAQYLDITSTEQVTLFGYSQGGAVISNELQRIAALNLDQSVLDRLHVVTIGGIENPDGGLWQRLGFLPRIPFLDISFNPAMKTDNGFDTTAIGFEYDPVTYAPRYWGNPLALLNAVAALETVHGYYLSPDGTPPSGQLPYGYTPETLATQLDCKESPDNCRYGSSGETTYIMIPATSLPIFDLIMGLVPAPLKPLVKPFVNLLTPVTKLLIDLGYDWSGDPDKPTRLSILPFNPLTFHPVQFSVQFVQAIGQGIRDALNGGPSTVAPVTTAPVTTTVVAEKTTTVAATTDTSAAADKGPVATAAAEKKAKAADARAEKKAEKAAKAADNAAKKDAKAAERAAKKAAREAARANAGVTTIGAKTGSTKVGADSSTASSEKQAA
ncbi:PE-PPE domain-containing protein [Mycolicibacterium hodleri]|nr:PE-PPE domain-containing protein [Mycolicibacterium hodleri]